MEDQNSTAQTPEQSSGSDLHDSALSVVEELVYWRDVRRSALVFGGSLLVLISLATFSLISVLSYLLLAMLCVTITFRVYKSVIQAVQKSDEGHPFKVLLERNISITPDMAHGYMDIILLNLNQALIQTRRLLLVEDVVDSLKLAGLMWVLTYVGAVFNGVTLLILADIVFFCTPLVYEKNKTAREAPWSSAAEQNGLNFLSFSFVFLPSILRPNLC
uniref:Reticulon n=1 Tax=Pygocentrus nattereri TaxID=42514 RepID=A0AAR2JYK0_PYGNA